MHCIIFDKRRKQQKKYYFLVYYTELQKKQITMIWMPFQIILYFLCNFDVIILKAIYMLFFSKYDIIPLKNPQYHNKGHNPKLYFWVKKNSQNFDISKFLKITKFLGKRYILYYKYHKLMA